jgi:hypothetical protein
VSEIKIRPLCRKDRVALSGMILKIADKMKRDDLLTLINRRATGADGAAPDDGAAAAFGIEIVKMILGNLEDDARAWFADLVCMTPEEFDKAPFDADLKIIEQLKSAPEFADFFDGALRLFNGINS